MSLVLYMHLSCNVVTLYLLIYVIPIDVVLLSCALWESHLAVLTALIDQFTLSKPIN
jgi:hypothetical protein